MSLPPKKAQENPFLPRRLEPRTFRSAAYPNQMKTRFTPRCVVDGEEPLLVNSFSLSPKICTGLLDRKGIGNALQTTNHNIHRRHREVNRIVSGALVPDTGPAVCTGLIVDRKRFQ